MYLHACMYVCVQVPYIHIACNIHLLQRLGSPSKAIVSTVKNNKGRLERNVAKDVDPDARAALQATEARPPGAIGRRVVEVRPRDGDSGAGNAKRKARQALAAGKRVAALRAVVLGAADLGIVRADDATGDQEQRGAGIGNARRRRRVQAAAAHGVAP